MNKTIGIYIIINKATGINSRQISAVCLHKKYRKSAGGYRWEFIEKV